MRGIRSKLLYAAPAVLVAAAAAPVWAEEAAPTLRTLNESVQAQSMAIDTIWTLMAAFLVFLMQAGFACVEGGFTRAKNQNNIMMKNLLDFCIGSIMFFIVGFGLMFGTGNLFVGASGWFLKGDPAATFASLDWANMGIYAKFLFQMVFAATAATIVSGAMAERTKFSAYLIYCVFICAIIYPVSGHWIWGGGWLSQLGMLDFAGSTVVHSVGGWLALAGAIVVGPRLGKFRADGSVNPILGHNLPMSTLGVFLLWFGWFGFNAGSTMAGMDGNIGLIVVTTCLAASAGVLGAMLTAWVKFGRPDIGMSLNGALAGLVAITAPCAFVTPEAALLIGFLGGVLVVGAVLFFDKIKVDDPVGAVSVHGVCGAWGTLALGLFSTDGGLLYGGGVKLLLAQAVGVAACFVWAFGTGLVLFNAIKAVHGIRVSKNEEIEGLDVPEHGVPAYNDYSPSGLSGEILIPREAHG